jgi:hypothetical protein
MDCQASKSLNLGHERPRRPLRVLLCLTSVDPSRGGLAAVNRNVVRALEITADTGPEVELRAVLYRGCSPEFLSLRDSILGTLSPF